MIRAERAEDRAIQEACRRRVERAWACTVLQRPDLSITDWELRRGNWTMGWAEFKNRQLSVRQRSYPDVWVALGKVRDLLARLQGPPQRAFFIFRAEFDDTLYYLTTEEIVTTPVRVVRRTTPRPDGLRLPSDTEEAYHVPLPNWRRISELQLGG